MAVADVLSHFISGDSLDFAFAIFQGQILLLYF